MKLSLLLSSLALLIFATAHAQENPYLGSGRALLGGGLSLGISDTENDDGNTPASTFKAESSYFNISPDYGKFYNECWMIGVSLILGYRHEVSTNAGPNFTNRRVQRNNIMGPTLFLRRYCPITPRFGAFVQPEISYRYTRANLQDEFQNGPDPNETSTNITRAHSGGIATQGGLYYFITEHLSLETNLLRAGFTWSQAVIEVDMDDNRDEPTNQEFDVQLQLVNQLSFSQILVLFLGTKKSAYPSF